PDDLGAHARGHLQVLGRAGVRVRHGGDRHDHDHDTALLLHRSRPTQSAVVAAGDRCHRAAGRRPAVSRGEPDEARAWAWLPLLIGVTTFTILTNWQRGRPIVTRLRISEEG